MIREVELNLFVPSSELLVRLASGDRPLGVKAGPPRIKLLRETYFDTQDQALRRRGMTCKLRQVEGETPSVVVTVGEGPDSEGITSRSRLTASAVGTGVFETLRGDSEPAVQIRKFVDPSTLRPHIALDIQRLGRHYRTKVLRRPVLLLYFDRIAVQARSSSAVFHEIRVRRRRRGGPLIRDIGQNLRDQHHLFPDGLSTLQRAYRILAMKGSEAASDLSPYSLSLVLALFRGGCLGLVERGGVRHMPAFRGSGEDAARALLADLVGREDLELLRLGTTEPREKRPILEVWVSKDARLEEEREQPRARLVWRPWHELLREVGTGETSDLNLLPALLLLTRRRLMGQLSWIPGPSVVLSPLPGDGQEGPKDTGGEALSPEIRRVQELFPVLQQAEELDSPLEARLEAAEQVAEGLIPVFLNDVRGLKERILSADAPGDDPAPLVQLDLLSVKVRAILDRLHEVVGRHLLPALKERDIHIRGWDGLMHEDRRAILDEFSQRYLPNLSVVADWRPALVPEMPSAGCALGLAARSPESEATRFFHLILDDETPSFFPVPGSSVVLPLEEVVRGFFFERNPELERTETHLFRFRTVEVTVLEEVLNPVYRPEPAAPEPGRPTERDGPGTGESVEKKGSGTASTQQEAAPTSSLAAWEKAVGFPKAEAGGAGEAPAPISPTVTRETKQSVVVGVTVHNRMPEAQQAQLIRALERQVSRRSPLIGWSDLYPVSGPLDLKGFGDLLQLKV